MTKTAVVRIDANQAMQMRVVKDATGMSILWMLSAAWEEWVSRHAGPKTVAGKRLKALKPKWED